MPQTPEPKFRVLAIAEHGGIHKPFVDAAKIWLEHESQTEHFTIDYIEDTAKVDDQFLSHYGLFIQLNYPPYAWTPTAVAAFQRYIDNPQHGWIGFHHATLLGEFDGYPIWPWFRDFMGGIRFKDYIATFVSAQVKVEDLSHPVMANVAPTFEVKDEEWYTYDKSPRPNVHVLASVNEDTYTPSTTKKMGDHPVVWTNDQMKARNIYIFMGHRPEHFQNPNFTTLFHNSILWAGQPRVLAFYSTTTESDHVEFAQQAIQFFSDAAHKDGFTFETTTNWDDLAGRAAAYQAILWLNDFPHTQAQRIAFEKYMTGGGAWLGFHVSAYNDIDTKWPWFVNFLGGAVFYSNNWPPLPAQLTIDDRSHAVTKNIPAAFKSPANEWYIWKPSPRENKHVKVLLTLDPVNYPLGFKDTLTGGDLPVVWTNTDYHMLYMNMGHGDKVFTDMIQNRLFDNAIQWLLPTSLPLPSP